MPYGSLDYRKFVCESQGHNSRDEKVIGLDKVTCFLIISKKKGRTLWLIEPIKKGCPIVHCTKRKCPDFREEKVIP